MPFLILLVDLATLGIVILSVLPVLLRRIAARGADVSCPTLVISRFDVAEPGVEREELIRIEGRATGLVSFALTKLGIENTVSFVVDRYGASLRGVGLNGRYKHEIPIRCIESTLAAYSESIWTLLFGAAVALLSLLRCLLQALSGNPGSAAGGLVLSALVVGCYLLYHHFSKRLLFAVTAGGEKVGVAFQRGVIGSMPIDFALVERASTRLDWEVMGRGSATEATSSA